MAAGDQTTNRVERPTAVTRLSLVTFELTAVSTLVDQTTAARLFEIVDSLDEVIQELQFGPLRRTPHITG